MEEVLTPPLAVAALVLCAAGLAKLRSPAGAVAALRRLGAPASAILVRAVALLEVGLGLWCLAWPSVACAAGLAFVYAGFSGLGLLLARRRSPCGCFGESQEPASGAQSLLSAALATVAALAAIQGAHGLPWVVGRPAATAAALMVALAGAVYATVIAYTELPLAWSAWAGDSR